MTAHDLAEAVKTGDISQVRSILYVQPELVGLDLSESNEHRALHFAVLHRDPEMVRLLMQAGADARKGIFPHRDATSALVIAQDRGYHDIVAVIQHQEQSRRLEPDIDEPPTRDKITEAIEEGNIVQVREIVQANPDLLRQIEQNGGLLTQAVNHGQIEIVRLLLDMGADVDERIPLKQLQEPTPSWGMPLWHAALENHFDIAKLLLNRGADPNANVYASGWPLRNAWNHEDGAIKRLLLEHGAKRQPYMVAEDHDVAEAERLIQSDASEALASELAWSASDHGCPAIVQLAVSRLQWPPNDPRWHWILIQPIRGATSNHTDPEGHFQSMGVLLRHGIDPNVSRYGQTALHFAAGYRGDVSDDRRAHLAAMLIDSGASLTIRDDLLKSTPLGWARRWGRQKLADLLIARGAPEIEPDAEPWATPQSWAEKYPPLSNSRKEQK
jgi:ankyrin repeat protein